VNKSLFLNVLILTVNEQDKEADILLYWNKSPLKSVDIEKTYIIIKSH